ncbi:MAG: hypothetical protein Q9163_000036 [Psora crenata]
MALHLKLPPERHLPNEGFESFEGMNTGSRENGVVQISPQSIPSIKRIYMYAADKTVKESFACAPFLHVIDDRPPSDLLREGLIPAAFCRYGS